MPENVGTEEPEYIVYGEDIMVKFKELQNAKVTEKVTEKVTGNLITESEKRVLEVIRIGSAKKGYWKGCGNTECINYLLKQRHFH